MSETIEINIAEIGLPGAGVPDGGSAGQVLSKKTTSDFDTDWVTLSGAVTDEEKAIWNAKADAADIPTTLAELADDSTHRLVTDAEKSTWNSSVGLALGETSTTAYRGDRGATAYTHSQVTGNPHGVTKADLSLENVDNTSDANKPVSTAQATALGLKVDKATGFGLSANDYTTTEKNKLAGIAAGAQVNDPHHITLQIDSTEIITTGEKRASVVCPVSGTITGWRLVSDAATTATVDIWKASGSRPTVANTITASAKPALAGASVASGSALTGWTTAVAVGDVFVMAIDANSAAKFLSLVLEVS